MHARIWKTDNGWRLEPSSTTELALFHDGDAVTVTPREAREAELDALAAEASRAVTGAHEAVNKLLGAPTAPAPSAEDDLVDPAAAKAQLDLVLSFFSRVETKLSVVLGIALAMSSVVFTKAAPLNTVPWAPAVALAAFVIFQALAMRELYLGSFPSLNGGHASLVYFREAAKMREADYTERFAALSKAALARDHLEQAWRNAKILTAKFDHLQRAYQWTAGSIIPWAIALVLLSAGGAH